MTNNEDLTLCVLNPWSVCNKADIICEFIVDNNIDVLAITETWLTGTASDGPVVCSLLPDGYDIIHAPRGSRGGGTAVVFRKSLSVTQVMQPHSATLPFEVLECLIRAPHTIRLCVIYRPDNRVPFINGFNDYTSHVVTSPGHPIIVGDFNVHAEITSDKATQELQESLSAFGLQQHVTDPTHRNKHTLDLAIGSATNSIITSCAARDCGFPDHYPVFLKLSAKRPPDPKVSITYRKTRNITQDSLLAAILSSALLNVRDFSEAPLKELITTYQNGLTNVMNSLAPLKTVRQEKKWYTDNIREAKQRRRRVERIWRKSGLTVHREMYLSARDEVDTLIKEAKMKYYNERVRGCAGNTQELFRILNSLLGRSSASKLPSSDPETAAQGLSEFFIEKIIRIRCSISQRPLAPTLAAPHLSSVLSTLAPITSATLTKLIASAPSKHCELDPIPTHLLKLVVHELTPLILQVVNTSLQTGTFPDEFKTAIVSPRLKKSNLDPECLNNYRPVSNLSFLSKIIEKAAASQLKDHLRRNDLMEPFQSAYRSGHSTETALLRVQTDIRRAIGEKKVVIMAMLDLSAAFDTVDHKLLIEILSSNGVRDLALQWFGSYLNNRKQIVSMNGANSEVQPLSSGIPQGSVIGPLLFTIYTSSLGSLLRSHGVLYHMYADDTQIYLPCDLSDIATGIARMEACLTSVLDWMAQHRLKVNADKTDFIVFASNEMTKRITPTSLRFDGCNIAQSVCVKNIGCRMDASLTCDQQVKTVCCLGYAQLKALAKIKKFIDKRSLEILIHALITTRIDYCNVLYYGINQCFLQKLQCLQNSCARLLTDTARYEHITPVLKDLHWLPVRMRILFKIFVLIFKFMSNLTPSYINDLLSMHEPTRALRHHDNVLLSVPLTQSNYLFTTCFSFYAPRLFNNLPLFIRSAPSLEVFKKNLKTYLFSIYF